MEERKIVIQGQVPSQKNSKTISYNYRTGRPFIRTEDRVKVWQLASSMLLRGIPPIHNEVSIDMWFFNKDRRKRDIDNMMTSVLDLLKNNEIIDDDNCFVVRELSGSFCGVDKNNPRVEVYVRKIDISRIV